MPLRNVADINARLDAVQDIMDHPTFEAEFADIAKGLPDLERVVSRIHAKNCKVKDFLAVLAVSCLVFCPPCLEGKTDVI
jgi:DNA mismatch repair protein MSH6